MCETAVVVETEEEHFAAHQKDENGLYPPHYHAAKFPGYEWAYGRVFRAWGSSAEWQAVDDAYMKGEEQDVGLYQQ